MQRGDIIKSKSIIHAVALITIFSVITRALGFLYKIILSRTLTTSVLGSYSIAMSIAMVITTFFTSGIPLAISRITAQNYVGDNKKRISASVMSGLLICVSIFVISALIILFGQKLFVKWLGSQNAYEFLLFILPYILCLAIYSPFRGYLWGKEEYFKVSVVELIEEVLRVVILVVVSIIFMNNTSLLPTALSLSVSAIISITLGIIFYVKCKGSLSWPKKEFKNVLGISAPITGVRIATSLLQPLISIILPTMLMSVGYTKNQALSELGVTMGMTFPLLTIPSTIIGSLAMVLIPKLTSLQDTKNNIDIRQQLNSAIKFTLCCSFIVVPAFVALGIPACELIYNNRLAGVYLVASSFCVVPMCLTLICTSGLNSLGEEKRSFVYNIIGGVSLIACTLVLPQFIGIYSLIVAFIVNSSVVAILSYIRLNKKVKLDNKNILAFCILFILTVPITLLTKYIYNLCMVVFPNIVSLMISGIISVVAYSTLMVVFNILDISVITSKYSHKKPKKHKRKQKV